MYLIIISLIDSYGVIEFIRLETICYCAKGWIGSDIALPRL